MSSSEIQIFIKRLLLQNFYQNDRLDAFYDDFPEIQKFVTGLLLYL